MGPRFRRSSERRRSMAANGDAESGVVVRPSAEEERRDAIAMEKMEWAPQCAPAEFHRRTCARRRMAARRARVARGAESLKEDGVRAWGTRNHRTLIWRRRSWAENGQARTASPRGPPRGAKVHAWQEDTTREATQIHCGTLTARGS
jgi:hypothetical protein